MQLEPQTSTGGWNAERTAIYSRFLAEDRHDRPAAFLHGARRIFQGIDLRGKTVLEIGSGKGLMSLFAAIEGACRVVSMEPEMIGSRSGMIELQKARIAQLGLDQIEFLTADFNLWEPAGRKFDLVLSFASINHLQASRRHALRDEETFRKYSGVASKMRDLLEPGGTAVITDACRHAFFTMTRLRRPWHWRKSKVNWREHQNPGTWKRIFAAAGFRRFRILYPVPFACRRLGPVVGNGIANFFLQGSFIFHASS
jgi:cyclopropane fatty-acyl-phospholipid synthase-like methyltransferase